MSVLSKYESVTVLDELVIGAQELSSSSLAHSNMHDPTRAPSIEQQIE
jgi:hypothetical protein